MAFMGPFLQILDLCQMGRKLIASTTLFYRCAQHLLGKWLKNNTLKLLLLHSGFGLPKIQKKSRKISQKGHGFIVGIKSATLNILCKSHQQNLFQWRESKKPGLRPCVPTILQDPQFIEQAGHECVIYLQYYRSLNEQKRHGNYEECPVVKHLFYDLAILCNAV